MAHETAKKNARNNAARIQKFKLISMIIMASCCVMDWFVTERSGSLWTFILWNIFWGAHHFLPLFFLTALSKPTLHPSSREIIECIDMSEPKQLGIYSYAQDILWFCWVLQPLQVLVSSYFMLLYLPIPLYGAYKIYNAIIAPLLSARSAMAGGGGGGGDDGAGLGGEDGDDGAAMMNMMRQQQNGMPQARMSARQAQRKEAKGKK